MQIISEKSVGNKTLRLVKGDITERDVDAIVNAANSYLQHGGGVAAAIVKKGGSIIQEQSNKVGYVPVGSAAVTRAGSLPCKAVIHAVGPRMGEGQEDEKLASAVDSSLQLASEHNFESISMPAISSGIFGFPKDRCASILIRQTRLFLEQNAQSSLKIVEFCIYDDNTLSYFKNEFDNL
ncbi:MAG: macro domain-containing protein [Nitrospirae bacterium]|nr:macro domain-containing protein [Nitrospirota bacterium]